MPTSQEVFALRRSGSLPEAYVMALEIIETDPNDEWNIRALAWCLYDLAKQAVSQNDYHLAKTYINRLEELEISEVDDILVNSVGRIKILAAPGSRVVLQATEASRQGNHQEALTLFRQAIQVFPDDIDLNTQYAWELQKEGKLVFNNEEVDVQQARILLAEYIKLKNPRPSILHSLFLKFAYKLADMLEFNLINFLKLWNLSNLTEDDFTPYTRDGKSYPSIAEKVVQHAAKLILDHNLYGEVDFILPFLNTCIGKFQENIWLPYYKAKLLRLANRNEEAVEFLIPVVKKKIGEYWVWSLLADLVIEKETAISCYCKSLLCQGEDKYIASVRTKFAELLIQKELWNEAKFEIATAVRIKELNGTKVSDKLRDYQQKDWYINAANKKSNNDFYISHKQLAEEYIFTSLSWMEGCLAEKFTNPDRPDRAKRRLFVKMHTEIIEVVISDKKFNTSKNYAVGDSVKIKGEYNNERIFQIYLLEKRDSDNNWDLFEWRKGTVVQAIMNERREITGWRVSVVVGNKMKEGIIDTSRISEKIQIKEGLPVFVKLYQKDPQSRVNILSIRERTDGELWDSFPEHVGVIDHINFEKGIAHVIVNKKNDCILNLQQFREEIRIGSRIALKQKEIIRDGTSYYKVLCCSLTEKEPSENILKAFSGIINVKGEIGFVDDVFIDSSLMQEHYLYAVAVSGTAIISYNKRKGRWGWKAIHIDASLP